MIVYGKQIVLYILDKHPSLIEQIYLNKQIDTKLFRKFSSLDKKIVILDNKKAQAMAKGGNHQGFLLDIKEFQYSKLKDIKNSKFIVVLDGLTDVGNIGSICRTSYALGIDALIVCGLKDIKISQIVRVSSGAVLDIPVVLCANIADLPNELKHSGYSLIGACMNGEFDISDELQQKEKIALFVGNESKGLSKKVINKIDYKQTIDMENSFDSLNVSVATGIIIERLRRKIS
ncbi:MAG: 23S rRNA (guanosine(2251)-2'-O)-methyltransferase RlmB [Campylobacteraceae bacterium 4484_166]|nr:MAG: 23S rRNA (guanosine(2251)-2'-O)-methyltransferase RlmB [Campylobacteraceae bacterium 4484_166]